MARTRGDPEEDERCLQHHGQLRELRSLLCGARQPPHGTSRWKRLPLVHSAQLQPARDAFKGFTSRETAAHAPHVA